MAGTPDADGVSRDLDVDRLTNVIEDHPVRLAVVFGSHVRSDRGEPDDIDIAVEFDGPMDPEIRLRARLALLGDLMTALGTDDVDLADLDTVRPRVGVQALRTGMLIVGSERRREQLCTRFERQVESLSHEERMRRFDRVLAELEAHV